MTMLGWMTYAIPVGLLFGGAAWLLDRSLTAVALPSRWVWLIAMAASVGAPMIAARTSAEEDDAGPLAANVGQVSLVAVGALPPQLTGPGASPPGWAERARRILAQAPRWPDRLLTTGTATLSRRVPTGADVDRWFSLAWVVTSIGLGLFLWVGPARLRRRSRSWPEILLDGRRVRVSPDFGPAAMGPLKPQIVLPRWSLDLPAPGLALVLDHEEEHVIARDPLSLAFGAAAAVAMPWNAALWWQLRGLRDAVEVDCDRRVLRRRADPARYGRVLVKLGVRGKTDVLLTPALSGSRSLLERRIDAMRKRSTLGAVPRAMTASVAAIALIAAACSTRPPEAPADSQEAAVPPQDLPALDFGPAVVRQTDGALIVFSGLAANPIPYIDPFATPHDVAPAILDAAEVGEALDQFYPAALRAAGISGTSLLRLFVSETGAVDAAIVQETSGTWALDVAAREAALLFEFTPAMDDGRPVPAWISIPITFDP